MNSSKLVYVAAPYSAIPDKTKLMEQISKFCADYMIEHPGVYLVPGLVHHYAYLQNNALGDTYEFWQDFCRTMIDRSDMVFVLKYPGWEKSVGVSDEVEYSALGNKPVTYFDV